MQGRDEYEFDYYGGAPYRADDDQGMMPRRPMQPGMMPRRSAQPGMMPRRTMQPDTMPGRPMQPRETCCQSRINEILEEMERFEEMQSEGIRRINAEIRKVCGAIDGRGCVAIEGEPDREMMEMLMEQVMDRLDQMPDGMGEEMDGMEAVETQMGRRNWRGELVEALIWQELLRRRMRRRRHGRRDRY